MIDNFQFSEREREVIDHLLRGKSNKQIALALGISASTVEYHLKNIYKKLQVNSRTEAVLRLGKSTGGGAEGELGKPIVEIHDKTIDNGAQPISTWRISVNKTFAIVSGGFVVVGLIVIFSFALFSLANQRAELPSTGVLSQPDLAITASYVSMVDNNGVCLSYYGFNVTVVNQGNAPALDVMLADNTGQKIGVGDLNPLQSTSVSFVAKEANGAYAVVVDPQNSIAENDENNNTAIFSGATATPFAPCLPSHAGSDLPTPEPTATPLPLASPSTFSIDILRNGLYYSPDWGDIQLSNGVYYRTPPTSQESNEAYATYLSDNIVSGDLNLDGFEDAVVFLSTQNGGTGHFVEMAVVLNFNGSPVNVSTLYLGDRVIIESGSIQDGRISINLRVQGPDDAACCPSQLIVRNFVFDGSQLIEMP